MPNILEAIGASLFVCPVDEKALLLSLKSFFLNLSLRRLVGSGSCYDPKFLDLKAFISQSGFTSHLYPTERSLENWLLVGNTLLKLFCVSFMAIYPVSLDQRLELAVIAYGPGSIFYV